MIAVQQETFCFQVTDIELIEDEFELRHWKVKTRQGARQFQTELSAWPRSLPNGSHMVQDVYGDLYMIPPVEQLPPAAREIIWSYID